MEHSCDSFDLYNLMPKFLASFDRFSNCWPAASKAPSLKEETVMQNYVKAISILGGFLCQHMLLLNHWCFCLWGKGTWAAGVSSGRLSFQHAMYDGWKVGSLRVSTSLASEWKSLSDTLVSRIAPFDVKDSKVSSMWGKAQRASESRIAQSKLVWYVYWYVKCIDALPSTMPGNPSMHLFRIAAMVSSSNSFPPRAFVAEAICPILRLMEKAQAAGCQLHRRAKPNWNSFPGGRSMLNCWTIRFMVKFMADWLWLSFTHPKKQQYSTSAVHSGSGRRTRVLLPARRTVTAWRLRIPKRAQRQKLSERKEQFVAKLKLAHWSFNFCWHDFQIFWIQWVTDWCQI